MINISSTVLLVGKFAQILINAKNILAPISFPKTLYLIRCPQTSIDGHIKDDVISVILRTIPMLEFQQLEMLFTLTTGKPSSLDCQNSKYKHIATYWEFLKYYWESVEKLSALFQSFGKLVNSPVWQKHIKVYFELGSTIKLRQYRLNKDLNQKLNN